MIDLDNLRTASLYINNQLLSRGLIHDGQTINFTRPGDSDTQLADTMGKVMGVVNDLILRRDRDAEHRESLSTTIRSLRAESLRQTNDVTLLRERNTEVARKAALAEAEATSLRSQLKAAETTIHKLKDEAAKMKTMVAQTRSACANEVRKRDRQIDGLKKAVSDAGRARGAGRSSALTTITVTGEVGGEGAGMVSGATVGEGYDLRMETNSFLAELAKGLSEENETLLGLVRRTTASLKDMSGWEREVGGDGHAQALAVNPEEMAGEIEGILEHLRTILTNPSFVPIEEVVMREDEINRLRDGWEKMETRWSEAVHLMDGWKRRMQADGRPVNVEELKMGLRLSPVRIRDVAETAHSQGLRLAAVEEEEEESRFQDSLHLVPAPEFEADDVSDAESSIFEDDLDVNDLDVEEPNVQVLQQSVMFDSSPLPPPPQLSPLKDSYSAGNRGEPEPVPIKLKARERPGDFTTIVEENTYELREEEARAPEPPPHLIKPQSPKKQASRPTKPARQEETPPSSVDLSDARSSPDSIKLVKPEETSTSKPASSAPAPAPTRQRPTTTRPTRPDRPEPTRQAPSRPTTRTTRTTRQQEQQQPTLRSQRSRTELAKTSSSPSQPPPPSTTKPLRTTSATSTTSTATTTSTTSTNTVTRQQSPVKPTSTSRLPLPRSGANILPPPVQSPLTVATINAKLVASEKQADAARVRAKLRAAKLTRAGRRAAAETDAGVENGVEDNAEGVIEVHVRRRDRDVSNRSIKTVESVDDGQDAPQEERETERVLERSTGSRQDGDGDDAVDLVVEKPRKRERRTGKAASRRRSTLNPWELQTLIQGDVGVDAS